MKPQSATHNKSVRLFTEKYVENLETIFKSLYKDEILSDVTFHCKDGSVKAHKAILASSSAYFRQIFYEHPEPEAVYIMYGISVNQMRSLVELIYRGNTEVPCDVITSLYEMVDEMGVKGVVCSEDQNTNRQSGSPSSTHNRDTRFRGTKRVAVNFQDEENHPKRIVTERRSSTTSSSNSERSKKSGNTGSYSESSSEVSTSAPLQKSFNRLNIPHVANNFVMIEPKTEPQDGDSDRIEATIEQEVNEIAKKTSWQLKQRKFKCQLCPSSFKRASHLSRHQLVHTGERPWPCGLCDKAFSRHDKLKNHIKKNHEDSPDDPEHLLVDVDDSLYTIGHVQILTPSANGTYDAFEEDDEPSNKITREDLEPPPPLIPIRVTPTDTPEHKFTPPSNEVGVLPQKEVAQEQNIKVDGGISIPQKKGRGRPRKYPPGCLPLQTPHKVATLPRATSQIVIPLIDIANPPPKRRGRPPKIAKIEQINSGFLMVKKNKRGAKPKNSFKTEPKQEAPAGGELELPVQKKKRGRKPKNLLNTDIRQQKPPEIGAKRGPKSKNAPTTKNYQESDSFMVLQKQKKRGRPRKYPPVILKLKRNSYIKRKKVLREKVVKDSNASSNSTLVPQKRGVGRPRKEVPKPLFKRPRGRPRLNAGQPSGQTRNYINPYSRQPVNILPKPLGPGRRPNNYDITNMPFGDLETLMSADAHSSSYMEPYVEIKTEHQAEYQEEQEFTDASEMLDKTGEIVDITDTVPETTISNTSASSFLQNIGLSAVNPIGQIGQCTISLTGSTGCTTTGE